MNKKNRLENLIKIEKTENGPIVELPSLKVQKKIVKKLEKKVRTSFELTEGSLKLLEKKAIELKKNTSEILDEIIHMTTLKPDDTNQKRLKNFTLIQHSMNKLDQIGESLIPEKLAGKRGVNKSFVVELLIQQYFKDCDEHERLLEKYGDIDDDYGDEI
jgi:hypothetical protein